MVGWSIRMISRLTLTSILRNGCSADQRLLRREGGEARLFAQRFDESANSARIAGEEEIDALLGEQDRALEPRDPCAHP